MNKIEKNNTQNSDNVAKNKHKTSNLLKEKLRQIPQIDKILQNLDSLEVAKSAFGREMLKNIAKNYIKDLREKIINSKDFDSKNSGVLGLDSICDEISKIFIQKTTPSLKRVINASGVVLHTNLGRSIFDKNLLDEISPILCGYSNLEYDLERGVRGERYSHIRDMLCAIFNTQDALIVNNNAAAVFLILNTFGKNCEAIISRGELIEIGGSFRIPEIMANAGVRLVEVGATNKTKLSDYKNAITPCTRLIMKAHKSNFDMIGFVKEVEMSEISALVNEVNRAKCNERVSSEMESSEFGEIIDYYDLGSGYLGDISSNGSSINEPSISSILSENPPSLISFSGDKLLGSTQAGIILGKKSLIDKLKQNHLLRALRVDKSTIAILQATISRYIDGRLSEIPTLNMLSFDINELKSRSERLKNIIDSTLNPQIIELESLAGGGSLPNERFKSIGVSVESAVFKPAKLDEKLRQNCVVARILNDKITFDLRTIQNDEIEKLGEILNSIAKSSTNKGIK